MDQTYVLSVQVLSEGSDVAPNFFSVVRGLQEAGHVFAFFGGDSRVCKAEGQGLFVFVVDDLDTTSFAQAVTIIKNIFRDLGITARVIEAKKLQAAGHAPRAYDERFFGLSARPEVSAVLS